MRIIFLRIKIGGNRLCVFELRESNTKLKDFLRGFVDGMVTYYVTIMNEACLAIIILSNHTILLSPGDTYWFIQFNKGQGF